MMADINQLFGKTVLWIGNECEHWTPAQFASAAAHAHALGFNTICPKRADGTIKWYGSAATLTQECNAVRSKGVGYLPFGYCYGPRFGSNQIRGECAILQEMGDAVVDKAGNKFVQADMEAEWNGQVWAAQYFEQLMRPWQGLLSVSTWADPTLQDWDGVALALSPAVNAWTPQRYTDWLSRQPLPPEETIVQPGVDMTQEFGTNHPVSIATGHPCVFVWEYNVTFQNPTLAKQLTGRVG